MGSSDNFCLRWNDFEANISTSFRELRQDSEFFDVTLCCDNGTDVVQAHKVILAACSPLFRRILARQKNQQHPFLYLKGIRLKELTSVLNFMYHGEVNVAQDSLNGFLAVAEELAVKGLTTDSKPSSYEDAPRRKATAKRKSQSTSGLPKRAKVDEEDDEESRPGTATAGGGTDPVDVKSIKAEPEVPVATASGSGGTGPDESFTGDDGADNGELYGSGTGGGAEGDDFDSFGQYGEGEFDDSSSGAPASGTGADGKETVGGEEARFVKSQFGRALLLDKDEFLYNSIRACGTKVYWRCVYYPERRGGCKARANTDGFFIVKKAGEHDHKPGEPRIQKPHGNRKYNLN